MKSKYTYWICKIAT